jgi:hypothetical protein
MPRPLYPGKNPVPIVYKTGWASEPVWTGAENLGPHRDSIPGPSSPQRVAIPTELKDIESPKCRLIFTASLVTGLIPEHCISLKSFVYFEDETC